LQSKRVYCGGGGGGGVVVVRVDKQADSSIFRALSAARKHTRGKRMAPSQGVIATTDFFNNKKGNAVIDINRHTLKRKKGG